MDQLALPVASTQRNRKNQQTNRRTGRWERVEQRTGNIPPCQRSLHASACWRDNMLVFGGYDGHVRLNDLHCYNFTSNKWTILNSYQAPSPRDRHSAVIFENYLVIFGGFDGVSRVDDLHMFDLESMQWESIEEFTGTPPTARHSHSAVRWRDCLYIFGGYDGSYRSDFHEFNFTQSKWTQINAAGDIPRARYRGTCVVYENSMILHGGHDGSRHLQDTHIFDFMTKAWHTLETTGPIPSPRDSHVAVVYKKSMFIYGGSTGSAMGDFHELKVAERVWQSVETIISSSSSSSMTGSQHTQQQPQPFQQRIIDGASTTEGHNQSNSISNVQQPFVFGSTSSSSSAQPYHQQQQQHQYNFTSSPNRLSQQHSMHAHSILQSHSSPDIISAEGTGNNDNTTSTSTSLFSSSNPFVRSNSTPPQSSSHYPQQQYSQSGLEGSVFGPRSSNSNTSRYNNSNNSSMITNPFHHRHSIHNDTNTGGNEIFNHHSNTTSSSQNQLQNQQHQHQLASTSIFYYNSAPTSSTVANLASITAGSTNTTTTNGGGNITARAGSRFCHVGVVYDDSLFVFGGYDGQTRLNDFVRFRFESVEEDLPPSTLLTDLRALVDNELLSDVTFIVDNVPVRAHKVLCLRCPYFRNLLTGEYMESRANEIVIPDVRHAIFLQFLQFVYCDHVDFTTECAMELFQTADRFGFERLKKITENVMLLALSIETAGQILLAADMHNANHLRERCMNFIVNNFDDVSKTAGFEEMARGDVELLFEILRRR